MGALQAHGRRRRSYQPHRVRRGRLGYERQYMLSLEVDAHDMVTLFRLMDDGDGVINLTEFVEGVSAMRGTAKSLDMLVLLRVTRQIEQKIDRMVGDVSEFSMRLPLPNAK